MKITTRSMSPTANLAAGAVALLLIAGCAAPPSEPPPDVPGVTGCHLGPAVPYEGAVLCHKQNALQRWYSEAAAWVRS